MKMKTKRIIGATVGAAIGWILSGQLVQADDVIINPQTTTINWSMQTQGEILSFGVGFVSCFVDNPQESDLIHIQAINNPTENMTVTGSFEVDYAIGDLCLKGVALSSGGKPSIPTANALVVILIPNAPVMGVVE